MLTIAGGIILALVILGLIVAMFSGFARSPGKGIKTMLGYGFLLALLLLIFA